MPDLVSKADAQLRAIAAQIDDEEALPDELQDVAAAEPAAAEDEDESTDDQTEDEAETEDADADTDDDDEDDGDGAAGLGEMFG